MTGEFTVHTSDGKEVVLSAGYDAQLDAVIQGPWSDSLAFRYCHDLGAYCDVDNCKLTTHFYCHNVGADEMRVEYRGVPVYAMAEDGA